MCLRIIDEVPYDEIVIGIAHAVNDGKLILGSLHIVFFAARGRSYFKSFLKSLICQIRKIFFMAAVTFRNFINRKVNGLKIVFGIAHIGDLAGILNGLGKFRKETPHLGL